MTEHKPTDYLSYIDRVWQGGDTLLAHLSGVYSDAGLVTVRDRVGFLPAFANVAVFDTGAGLVMVDSGDIRTARPLHEAVRAFSKQPVTTVVYTHGHVDHAFGVAPFDAQADSERRERPEVVAHEAVTARFDRYISTAGYNSWINRRQFGVPSLNWPSTYRYPDTTYRDRMTGVLAVCFLRPERDAVRLDVPETPPTGLPVH